jgi:hypothetical protein
MPPLRSPWTTGAGVACLAFAAFMVMRSPKLLETEEGWGRVAVPLAAGVGLLKAADEKGSR